MKLRLPILVGFLLLASASAPAARAQSTNTFIIRTTLGSQLLSSVCILDGCTLGQALDGTLNQLFTVTAPTLLNPNLLLGLLRSTPGIVDAELDQVLSLVGGLNQLGTISAGLLNNTLVPYVNNSVWQGYAIQPASGQVSLPGAQATFNKFGTGIIADIDTGVDPTHPALQGILLQGYDFTRNQAGASELLDFTSTPPSSPGSQPAQVNHFTAAMVDSPTADILNGNVQYAAFGHGTMVMGILHLVAPQAQLLPLKAFQSSGSGSLSDIIRAIYYAAQNNARVINMSFDLTAPSPELATALSYANELGIICVASAGNDGAEETVYPAALNTTVMGVASVSPLGTRSVFSNFGDSIVWVAAPGEAIITTFPFDTYSVGWGTSFAAPFVSGTAALLLNAQANLDQSGAANAIAHANFISNVMGNGLLNISLALGALTPGGSSPTATLSTASLTFTNQAVGVPSGALPVTLTNSGGSALAISSASISAPNSLDFGQTNNCGTSVAAGASCTFQATFDPTASGLRGASLVITDNAAGSPHSVALSGIAIAPSVSLSVPSASFGSQLVTTSNGSQTVAVANVGNSLLSFSSISITGANHGDFAITSNGCGSTLAINGSCNIGITFTPSADGSRSASLSIADNAPGTTQLVSLTGTGSDFSVGLANSVPATVTVAPSEAPTFPMAVSSLDGFAGNVSLSCVTSLPASVGCSVTPSVSVSASAAGQATLTVTTTAASQSLPRPISPATPGTRQIVGLLALVCAFALYLQMQFPQRKASRAFAATALLLMVGMFCDACGNAGRPSTAQGGGTPAGSYTVTTTATSQSVMRSQTVTVNVD
jgi:hypothetical protein